MLQVNVENVLTSMFLGFLCLIYCFDASTLYFLTFLLAYSLLSLASCLLTRLNKDHTLEGLLRCTYYSKKLPTIFC